MKKLCLPIMITSLTASVMASPLQNYNIGVYAGFGSDNISLNQTLPQGYPNPKELYAQGFNLQSQKLFKYNVGFTVNRLFHNDNKISDQLGIGVFMNNNQTVNGSYAIIADTDPDGTFTYKLKNSQIVLQNSLFYQVSPKLAPYITVGVGMDYMRTSASSFDMASPGGAIVSAPASAATTKWNPMLKAAIGVQYAIKTHLKVSLAANQMWLGHQKITVNNGQQNQAFDFGRMNPWFVQLGLVYQF